MTGAGGVGDHDDGEEWDDGTLGREWRAGEGGDGSEGGATIDPDHAAAVRTLRLAGAAGVLVVLAVLATLLSGILDDGEDADPSEDPVLGAEPVVAGGPAAGEAVAGYLAERQAALEGAEGTRVAVVSLTSYRPDTAVDDVLGAVGGLEVLARLAAVRGGEPSVVTGPISSWLVETRGAIQAERDEIAALLPTIEDPADPFIATYTEDLARLDAQLATLDPAGDLVFGVVVRGSADALRRLAGRPEVRLVDVAEGADADDLTAYRGLRPEETDAAGTPPTRPP